MTIERDEDRCIVARSGDATTQRAEKPSLQDLARLALQESSSPPSVAAVATVAGVAAVAQKDTKALLTNFAKRIGVPASVVDNLTADELEATAEQIALCKGHLDTDGNPLAGRLLTFYLRTLADQPTTGSLN